MPPVLLFAFVGTAGFIVDAGVLLAMEHWLGAYWGRIVSFVAAVVTTWLLNRSWTFRDRHSGTHLVHEFVRYFCVCLGGGSLNLAVYSLLVWLFTLSGRWLLLAVAVGSLAGMAVNYLLSKHLVFSRQRHK